MRHLGDFAYIRLDSGEYRRVIIRAASPNFGAKATGVATSHYRVDDGEPANSDLMTNGFRYSAWVTESELFDAPLAAESTASLPRKGHGPATKSGWLRWLRDRAKAKNDHAAAAYATLFLAKQENTRVTLTAEAVEALLGANHAMHEAVSVMLARYVDAAIELGEFHEDTETPDFW